MSVTGFLRAQLPVLALVAIGLTACGSDQSAADDPAGSDDPSTSPAESPAAGPECGTLWQDGTTLPRSYDGCVDDSGQFVEKDALGCSSGQTIVRYDDTYYAVLGGSVHEASAPLDQDREYRAAVLRCRA
jgi:hypothetical protein